jgi:hypothetical protein
MLQKNQKITLKTWRGRPDVRASPMSEYYESPRSASTARVTLCARLAARGVLNEHGDQGRVADFLVRAL